MRPSDNPASGPPRTTPRRRSRLLAAASVLFLCTVYMVAGTGASQSSRGCRNTWHQHAGGSPGVAITFSSAGHRSAVAGTTSTLMPRIMARRDRSVEQPG